MTRRLSVLVIVLCVLVVSSAWSEAATLYAANGAQGHLASLVILEQATGAVASTVGPIGFAITGLAVHPATGVMYGSVSNAAALAAGSLITINKTTGAGTLVGSFGVPNHTMADLTFGSDGTLYGWAEPDIDALHRIDLATGQATRIGTATFPGNTFGSGIAATASSIVLAPRGGNGFLYLVSRTTGAATALAALDWIPGGPIAALAFAPGGALFAMGLPPVIGSAAVLLRIDPKTGRVTPLGPTIDFGDALAFDPPSFPADPPTPIPTLSELAFGVMAILLTAIAVSRVRRRARG